MANIKIGDLVTLTDPISTDVLPIVDVSADTTNKVTIEELLKNAANGTQSLPAFAFDADPNTGMYRSGADALAFSTGGTGRLFIDSSGNIGVGTSTPGEALDVNGTVKIGNTKLYSSGSGGTFDLKFQTYSGGFFDRLTITGAGNVGIGTTSPNSYNNYLGLTLNSPNTGSFVDFQSNGTLKGQIYASSTEFRIEAEGSTTPLIFQTSGDDRMEIDSSGNVGIGGSPTNDANTTTFEIIDSVTPRALFKCTGTGGRQYGWYTSTDGQFAVYDYTAASERMRINSSGDVSIGTTSILTQTAEFRVYSSGACAQELAASDGTYTCYSSGPNSTSVVGRGFVGSANQLITSGSVSDFAIRAQSALVFASNGSTERMRIDSSGHVGIGTTSPDTDLHVSSSTSTLTKFQNTLSTSVYLRFQNTDNARGYVGYEGKRLVFYADNGSNTGDKRVAFMDADGLKFNSDTAQVNALNDYEEGTFVPAINRDTTSPTVAYNWQTGKYTKIGNMVLIYFDLEMSSNSGGSGRYFIDNLPFDTATGNTSGGYGSPQFRDSGAFNNDANKFSTSSYHYLDTIQLRYMDMASTNNEVDITVGTGRITGWSMYFTDS